MNLKNTIKISIIMIIIIFSYSQISAQTTVHSGNNVICTGDSLVLYAPEHRGSIQWQISTDGINWTDIDNAATDTLGINPSSSTYYRTKIIEGTCEPFFTDSVFVDVDNSVVISENTYVIDTLDWQTNFISMSADSTIFTFNTNVNAGNLFEAGDIFISAERKGYLRKVTSADTNDNQIIVTTTDASLEEAIETGSTSFNEVLSLTSKKTGKKAKINYLREGVSIKNTKSKEGLSFDINIELTEGVNITGDFSIIPEVTGDIEYTWHSLEYFLLEFSIAEELNLEGTITLLSINYEEEVLLLSIEFPTFYPVIGGVPVSVTPILETYIGANLNVNSEITAGIHQGLTYTAGIKYENSQWECYNTHNETFTYTLPSMTNSATATVYIKPKLKFEIYRIVSPSI